MKKKIVSSFIFLLLFCLSAFIIMFKKSFAMQPTIEATSNSDKLDAVKAVSRLHSEYGDCSFFEPLTESKDYTDIENLKYDMLARANHLYESGIIKTKLQLDDIDFSKAVKIYMGNPLDISDFQDGKSFLEKLSKQEYIWELPVKTEDNLLTFTFNVGKPLDESVIHLLTEPEIERIKSNEGHWFLLRVSWNNSSGMDYRAYVDGVMKKNSLSEKDGLFVLVGGIAPVYQPVLVEIRDNVCSVMASCDSTQSAFRMLTRELQDNQNSALRSLQNKDRFSLEEFQYIIEKNKF